MSRKAPDEAARQLKQALRATFLAPNGSMSGAQTIVVAAMAQFCAAGRSPVCFGSDGRVDERATMVAIGRQEVWHWMNQLLGIPDQEVARLAVHDMRDDA